MVNTENSRGTKRKKNTRLVIIFQISFTIVNLPSSKDFHLHDIKYEEICVNR